MDGLTIEKNIGKLRWFEEDRRSNGAEPLLV